MQPTRIVRRLLIALVVTAIGAAPAVADFTITGPVTFRSDSFDHTGANVTLIPTGTPGTYTKVTTDAKGRVTSGALITCADVTNAGTVCTQNTGTSGHTIGFLDENKTDSGSNDNTGTNTFAAVLGRNRVINSSDPLVATDCGKSVIADSGSTITVTTFDGTATVPAGKTCAIAVIQKGTGEVNFAAAGGTSIGSVINCTKVFGQFGVASLVVTGDAPTAWYLGGSCLP